MIISSLIQVAVLSGLVAAYPSPSRDVPSSVQPRDCSAHIEAFNIERRAKRSQYKRSFYPGLHNDTCILSPNLSGVTDWVANAPVRSDVTEEEDGISLLLDVGVMNVRTCEAMPNALVEIWHANAVGKYGSFLRGGTTTSPTGIAEISTIFPGRTAGSAHHIGIKIHPDWQGGNTITSSSTAHTGYLYFTDGWGRGIGMYGPYAANTVPQTLDANDPMYAKANAGGYSAIVDIESIQDDWPEGVVGYVTVGVNA